MTKGKFVLDNSASGQIAAGSVLLIFGILMLLMSAYKTYRFCIKYTCRDYLARRKMNKYNDNKRKMGSDVDFIGEDPINEEE